MPVVAWCYSGVTCNTTARRWVVVVVTPGGVATFASPSVWCGAARHLTPRPQALAATWSLMMRSFLIKLFS